MRAKRATEIVMMMKRARGRPERATWERRKDARYGFSVANLVSFDFMSSRVAGGKILSRKPWPMFIMFPRPPCSVPINDPVGRPEAPPTFDET